MELLVKRSKKVQNLLGTMPIGLMRKGWMVVVLGTITSICILFFTPCEEGFNVILTRCSTKSENVILGADKPYFETNLTAEQKDAIRGSETISVRLGLFIKPRVMSIVFLSPEADGQGYYKLIVNSSYSIQNNRCYIIVESDSLFKKMF